MLDSGFRHVILSVIAGRSDEVPVSAASRGCFPTTTCSAVKIERNAPCEQPEPSDGIPNDHRAWRVWPLSYLQLNAIFDPGLRCQTYRINQRIASQT
jgi:hypothetical protein